MSTANIYEQVDWTRPSPPYLSRLSESLMDLSPVQHVATPTQPDVWSPFRDWPPTQALVDAQSEAEVRASLIAAGQRMGLVVDDEASGAPQFARQPLIEL